MRVSNPKLRWMLVLLIVLFFVTVAGGLLARSPRPWTDAPWNAWIGVASDRFKSPSAAHDHDHDHHDHDHDHDHAEWMIELSDQARKNIGLTLVSVRPQDFSRTITIPGVVAERPGRTLITVSAPLRGIVTQLTPLAGEAVSPGGHLAELRIMHNELADLQRSLLSAIERREVVQREAERLEKVAASGVVAGKTVLERQYELQTLDASIRTDRQALVLHGLTPEQVDQIVDQRKLLSTVQLHAPELAPGEHYLGDYHVVELLVRPGEHVEAGSPLLLLADHCELYVQGRAFEHDAVALHRAADKELHVRVLIQEGGGARSEVSPLTILYVENLIDQDSRALRFYIPLPNEVVRDHQTDDGRRFHAWRFKPGQRVEIEIPVERWENRLVLPVDAVIQEGVYSFVYQQVDDHFERKEVHVEHRDHRWAVVAADGTLSAGDLVAAKGAYQIHLALRQQSGAGADHDHHHHH